jgi:hypothetical protein
MARGNMTGQILFRVISDGREYVVYTDGTIEGFGEGAIVFNYYPHLRRESSLRRHSQPVAHPDQRVEGVGIGNLPSGSGVAHKTSPPLEKSSNGVLG